MKMREEESVVYWYTSIVALKVVVEEIDDNIHREREMGDE